MDGHVMIFLSFALFGQNNTGRNEIRHPICESMILRFITTSQQPSHIAIEQGDNEMCWRKPYILQHIHCDITLMFKYVLGIIF